MSTITSANAIIMIGVPGLFPVPQQLQGFAADDVFDTDALDSAEVLMGVDGQLSAGFVFVPVKQNYSLQADSASNLFFDTWWAVQQQLHEVLPANANVVLGAVGTKWAMTRGFLTSFKPTPDAKKVLQPRRFTITWESVLPAPSGF